MLIDKPDVFPLFDDARFEKKAAVLALFFTIISNSFSIAFFEFFSSVLMGFVLLGLLRSRKAEFGATRIFLWLAAVYFAINLFSVTQSSYPTESWRGIFRVFRHVFLSAAVLYTVDSEAKLRKMFYCLAATALVIGLDALIQGLTGFEILRHRPMTPFFGETKRLTGPFGHANDFSAYLTVVFFVFFGFIQRGQALIGGRTRVFLWTGLAVVAACLAGTYSRGAWLAVGFTAALFALTTGNKKLFILVVGVILAAVFFSPPLVKMRLESLLSWKEGTVHERSELWSESVRMIREKPILGRGINTYARNEPFYKSGAPNVDNQYAHNGYLQMTAEIGLIGLASFLALLAYSLAVSFRSFFSGSGFTAVAGLSLGFGVLAFLIHSATDTDLQSVLLVNLLWISLGLLLAARNCLIRRAV